MANRRRTAHPRRPQLEIGPLSEWDDFAREEAAERRTRRWSVGIALALHLGFALLFGAFGALPTISHEVEREKKVFLVQPTRFEPPPPPRQEIPERRARRVPIPDPTPDDPEPMVVPEEIEPEIDLPDSSFLGFPEAPPVEPAGPVVVGGDVLAPVKIAGPIPRYTEPARVARIEGTVTVQAIVNKRGVVENVQVLKGLPMGLDQAAVDAVERWRFEPATLHGKPVDVYYTLTVRFQLN